MAATRAIEFAAKVGVDRIVIKGDSSVVTEALRFNNARLASYGLLVEDAKLLEKSFSELSYSHTKRKGNKVAHGLARLVLNLSDTIVWMEDIPPSISHFVQTNFTISLE